MILVCPAQKGRSPWKVLYFAILVHPVGITLFQGPVSAHSVYLELTRLETAQKLALPALLTTPLGLEPLLARNSVLDNRSCHGARCGLSILADVFIGRQPVKKFLPFPSLIKVLPPIQSYHQEPSLRQQLLQTFITRLQIIQ